MERFPSTLAVTALYAAAMLAGYEYRSISNAAEHPPTKVAASAPEGSATGAWAELSTRISAAIVQPAEAAPRDRSSAGDIANLFRPTSLSGSGNATVPFLPPRPATFQVEPTT